MNDTELRELLTRATDRIEADLVGSALAARDIAVRRRRRWAVVAAAAAAVVVMAGTLVVGGGAGPDPDPAPSPGPTVPEEPTPVDRGPEGPATQPLWDPFTVVDAPVREAGLPDPIVPDAMSAIRTVAEDPMAAAVLAWPSEDADVRLLGTDGRWRSVPGTRDVVADTLYPLVRPVLSPDGTKVAMAVPQGMRVIDVTDGSEQTVPWPAELAPPWDNAPGFQWLPDDDGFLVLHWQETWLLGPDGTAEPAPYPGRYPSLAVNPDGAVYQNHYQRRRLLTWHDDAVVQEAPLYQCERLVARYGLVACTTGSLEPFRSGPIVVDPVTGEVLGYAPIKDDNAVYSDNGHLTALGFLDADTVLLSVWPADFRNDTGGEAVHLVAWQFRTGTFERIATGGADLRRAAVTAVLVD